MKRYMEYCFLSIKCFNLIKMATFIVFSNPLYRLTESSDNQMFYDEYFMMYIYTL